MAHPLTAHQEQEEQLEERAYSIVTWRLVPFLCLCFVIAFLDRVNIAFAKLQMVSELGWSEQIYGLGAGIFFLAYSICEVPSNLIMHRVGDRPTCLALALQASRNGGSIPAGQAPIG